MIRRYKLMIPGPTQSPDYVLAEMSKPVLPHYESEWAELYWEIVADLKRIFGTSSDVLPINGSGTLSFEIAMASLLKPGDKVLCIDNSFYGMAMGRAAAGFGADVTFMQLPYFKPVEEEALRKFLEADSYRLVATAHHDTASGFLNPLETAGKLCREFDTPLLADCVSSVGGVPFKMDEWGVDFACASVQKALDCPAGIAVVGVSERGWKCIEAAGELHRGRFMNLANWKKATIDMRDHHPNLISIATNNMMGLRASLKSILKEGLENKKERMVRYGKMIRKGLANMGLKNLIEDEYSPLLTKVVFPDGIDREEARDFIRYHYGILVGIEFRIAHFGAGVDEDSITLILTGIEDFLRRKGISLQPGVCLTGLEEFRPRKEA